MTDPTNPHPENPLSSTDSPETYSTGDVNQGASQISTPLALAPVEPDELDSLEIEFLHGVPVRLPEEAKQALRAWNAKQVDAAVAAARHKLLVSLKSEADQTFGNVKQTIYVLEDEARQQLKNKE